MHKRQAKINLSSCDYGVLLFSKAPLATRYCASDLHCSAFPKRRELNRKMGLDISRRKRSVCSLFSPWKKSALKRKRTRAIYIQSHVPIVLSLSLTRGRKKRTPFFMKDNDPRLFLRINSGSAMNEFLMRLLQHESTNQICPKRTHITLGYEEILV